MSFIPCDRCHTLQREKLHSLYWAWYPEHIRRAYKERLCDHCQTVHIWPLMERESDRIKAGGDPTCDNCASVLEWSERNWLHLFLWSRGEDRQEHAFALCDSCNTMATGQIMSSGFRLCDRQPDMDYARSKLAERRRGG